MGRPTAKLAKILAYQNDEVLARFCKTWGVSRLEARRIFGDLMRYLWLTNDEPLTPVPIVDEMWHAFLMYTHEYHEFCERFFGRLVHHVPTRLADQRAWKQLFRRSPTRARARVARDLEREVAFVLAHLGEQVMLRWYVSYAERYDMRFFKRAYRPTLTLRGEFSPELRRRARVAQAD
jgi:hypothetical protein